MTYRPALPIVLAALAWISAFGGQKPQVAARDDQASIYIVRPSKLAPSVRLWTFTDDRLIAVTRGEGYTRARVAAGKHLLWTRAENIAFLELEIESGRSYYVEQVLFHGKVEPRVELVLLPETRGSKTVEACRHLPLKDRQLARGEAIAAGHLNRARSLAAEWNAKAQIAEWAGGSIFRVEGNDGFGAGFLVDRSGRIQAADGLHMAHFEGLSSSDSMPRYALSQSERIAVVLGPHRKVRARLAQYDAGRRTAILLVHPEVAAGLPPLSPASRQPTKGDAVVAVCPTADGGVIWHPGRVTGALRNPGHFNVEMNLERSDLGCPILDMEGRVLGTYDGQAYFGSANPQKVVVRRVLRAHASSGGAGLATGLIPPGPELLPMPSPIPYPRAMARRNGRELDPADYTLSAGEITLEFLTPPLLDKLATDDESTRYRDRATEFRYVMGRGFFGWKRHAAAQQAVVVIQAVPEIKKVRHSWAGYGFLDAMLNPSDRLFKSDFVRMELLADGIPVEPLRPDRICGRFVVHAFGNDGVAEWSDDLHGCYGSYVFPPEVFDGAARLSLRVLTDGPAGPAIAQIPAAMVERIQADFRPYLEMVADRGSPDDTEPGRRD